MERSAVLFNLERKIAMRKLITVAIACCLSLAAGGALAQEMKKDEMKKDTMGKGDMMKKDSMGKGEMKKDAMKKDAMKKDAMKKDAMGKDMAKDMHKGEMSKDKGGMMKDEMKK
jgi:pentapeptide MXKDX repeat protein